MRTLQELGRLNGSESIAAIARQTGRRLAEVRAEPLSLSLAQSADGAGYTRLTEAGLAALREVNPA